MTNEKSNKGNPPFTELINRIEHTDGVDSTKMSFLQNISENIDKINKEAKQMEDDYDKFGKI